MGITYKEYVWLIKPEDVNEIIDGGVIGCPCDYGISYEDCINCSDYMNCRDCMNQEIPHPVIAEAVEDGNAGLRYRKGEKFKLASCEINGDIEIYHADSLDGRCFISDHLEDFKFYIDKEKKEAQKEFTKADLRDGMMCEQRNGDRNLWFNGEGMEEITVKKEYETPEISLIPLDHAPREIIALGRHKRIRHKREQRDRCIYVIAALIYAWLGLCVGFCGASAYFMWALGVI